MPERAGGTPDSKDVFVQAVKDHLDGTPHAHHPVQFEEYPCVMMRCTLCHAAVPEDFKDDHRAWHDLHVRVHDRILEPIALHCDPQELPPMENRHLACAGCGASWWSNDDCECTCQDGNPNYERWESTMNTDLYRAMADKAKEHATRHGLAEEWGMGFLNSMWPTVEAATRTMVEPARYADADYQAPQGTAYTLARSVAGLGLTEQEIQRVIDALRSTLADADALRQHLDNLNEAGANPIGVGVDAGGRFFLITLVGAYAEHEQVFFDSPWQSDVDYGERVDGEWVPKPPQCEDCNAMVQTIDDLRFPVWVIRG